jgi:hypothetical protein
LTENNDFFKTERHFATSFFDKHQRGEAKGVPFGVIK